MLKVVEPATEAVITELPHAGAEEADAAVARAKAAFGAWRAVAPPERARELEKAALDAGLPEGVLNVVVGPGRVVGERLVQHPDVAKVAFTGSTAVGRRIGALASETIKRVTLELGGKSANVIFADADLEKAAASAPLAGFGNAGQDCCARSRILVERSALDRFMDALEDAVEAIRVGDPLDDATEMGPRITADH